MHWKNIDLFIKTKFNNVFILPFAYFLSLREKLKIFLFRLIPLIACDFYEIAPRQIGNAPAFPTRKERNPFFSFPPSPSFLSFFLPKSAFIHRSKFITEFL